MGEKEISQTRETPIVVTPFFEIPILGKFSRKNVIIEDTKETIPRSPVLQRRIDEIWKEEKRKAARSGIKFENRPSVVLISRKLENGKLYLKLGRGMYKDFIGVLNPTIRNQHPEFIHQHLIVSSVIETKDGYFTLNERSQKVREYHKWLGSFGGVGDVADVDRQGKINPFQWALTEISEESGIQFQEINSLKCLGIVKDKFPGFTEEVIMFAAKTYLTKSEIEEKQGKMELEEGPSVFLPQKPDEISKKVLWFSKIMVPDAAAILALLGRQKFGEEWFRYVIGRLRRRGNTYSHLTEKQRRELEERLILRFAKLT